MGVRHLLLAHSPTGGVNSSPWRCPSFHFSTIFPSPLHHLCSGFWLVVHRCSSYGMQLSWPCILGARKELKCQDSHRNLESKLLLDDDTWENVGGKRCLMDRESGWPVKFCTTIQLGQLCFVNQDALVPRKPDHRPVQGRRLPKKDD